MIKTIIKIKFFLRYFARKYPASAATFCTVSTLLIFSPLICLIPLTSLTCYFLFKNNPAAARRVWLYTFLIWYLIVIISLNDVYIMVGPDYPINHLIMYTVMLKQPLIFETLCLQTIVIVDFISVKLGILVYVPSIIHFFEFLIVFLIIFFRGSRP